MGSKFTFERVLTALAVLMCAAVVAYMVVSSSTAVPISIEQFTTAVSFNDLTAAESEVSAEAEASEASESEATVSAAGNNTKASAAGTVGGTAAKRSTKAAAKQAAATAASTARVGKININTATAEQLDELKGIGPVIAQKIVDYREKCGGFNSVDELINVSGIGEKKLAAIINDICVD